MSEFLITLGSFAFTGFVVSMVSQWAKQYITKKSSKLFFVVGLSIAGGSIAYFVQFLPGNIVEVIVGVFAAANSVYLVVVKWFNFND